MSNSQLIDVPTDSQQLDSPGPRRTWRLVEITAAAAVAVVAAVLLWAQPHTDSGAVSPGEAQICGVFPHGCAEPGLVPAAPVPATSWGRR